MAGTMWVILIVVDRDDRIWNHQKNLILCNNNNNNICLKSNIQTSSVDCAPRELTHAGHCSINKHVEPTLCEVWRCYFFNSVWLFILINFVNKFCVLIVAEFYLNKFFLFNFL